MKENKTLKPIMEIMNKLLKKTNKKSETQNEYINITELTKKFDDSKNPNTPVHVLDKLSEDESIYIRMAVSLNPNTPTYILDKLNETS